VEAAAVMILSRIMVLHTGDLFAGHTPEVIVDCPIDSETV
jgi:hypothetical protein